MNYRFWTFIILFTCLQIGLLDASRAQASLDYYLPTEVRYDESVPTPQSVIGHEVGEWHVTHDKLVYYFYELAAKSNRVTVEQIGHTYEFRPLLNVIITSPDNHARLEDIRQQHLLLADPDRSSALDLDEMPVVVRLGYSVHGNEASGANASLLAAYHLAAGRGSEVDEMLQNCIILIDPSLNPDGLQRFSTWVNEHKSKNLNPDPNGREFHEPWPGGRTNHYWFDLNRDWLLAQHPESIARLKTYHRWMPNVQTDHHEMESDASFFFQPGIPSRKNPLIPEQNVILTEKIATFHARALDEERRYYYTKESFDDFYFGKGSTYPDIQGAIGILFEQASVRGHLRNTENGELSFPFAIKNQFISSLSTIWASLSLRTDLLSFQRDFFLDALNKSKKSEFQGIIVGTAEDQARAAMLAQILRKHQIRVHRLKEDIKVEDQHFRGENSYVIPLQQKQYTLIRAIFDRQTDFVDSLFYDISAWNFDLSFNANIKWIKSLDDEVLGEEVTDAAIKKGEIIGGEGLAYAVRWDQYFAPGFLYALLTHDVIIKVANEPFTSELGQVFERGTVLIPVGLQEMGDDRLFDLLEKYSNKYHVKVHAVQSGLSAAGIDLGSSNFKRIQKPVIATLVGPGVSGYEAGELWHLLDQRFDIHHTMISTEDIDRVNLARYNVLLLPGGSYGSVGAAGQKKITEWVQNGGTVVAWHGALNFTKKLKTADLDEVKSYKLDSIKYNYSERPKARGAQYIGGAIFNMELDLTHPLAYGYQSKELPVFKRGDTAIKSSVGSRRNPFLYYEQPLLSGYASEENLERISKTPAVSISSFGAGKVINFVDNPNFRAFWYGTNKLLMNAIFWGDQISTR
jgi:hypothetical protein